MQWSVTVGIDLRSERNEYRYPFLEMSRCRFGNNQPDPFLLCPRSGPSSGPEFVEQVQLGS